MHPLELSPSDFRRLADRLTALAEQWLTELDTRAIAPTTSGTATEALFAEGLPEQGLKDAALDALGPVLAWGQFVTVVIGFLIIALVVFMMVTGINRMKREEAVAPSAPPAPSKEEVLLTEIRDAIRQRGM